MYIYIYKANYKDITATSLAGWPVRSNYPKIAFFQVSDLIEITNTHTYIYIHTVTSNL